MHSAPIILKAMQDAKELVSIVTGLLAAPGPLSFYDALGVTLAARRFTEPSDDVLRALVSMHDAPQATDGARAILAEYLSARAQRIHEQRQRSRRPLTASDQGKLVRAVVGETLEVTLAERRGLGFRWQLIEAKGSVQVIAQPARASTGAGIGAAGFTVVLLAAGNAKLTFAEEPPPGHDPRHKGAPKPAQVVLKLLVNAVGNA